MSHRTVGSHLYRIFPKLNITSRVELTRLVVERSFADLAT
jgi:DNA-binding NarL/FixJ family response regulator